MNDCIFCQIARGELPAQKVFEDEILVAFHDINPQAPVHILIIPKKHIPSLSSISQEDRPILEKMLFIIPEIVRRNAGPKADYRVVFNCGPQAGQSVFHLHCHLLSGREFGWPPG